MGVLEAISNFCGMVKNGFAFFTQKDAQKNAANVQAAAQAQKEVTEQARIAGDVAKRDEQATREDLAE